MKLKLNSTHWRSTKASTTEGFQEAIIISKMQSFSVFSVQFYLLLSLLLSILEVASSQVYPGFYLEVSLSRESTEFFCQPPSILAAVTNDQPLFRKVTNPTPSPSHMQEKKKGVFRTEQPILNTDSSAQLLYPKVTNPRLSPSHLQDLPGFTCSAYRKDHALITPESQVFSPLPDWKNTLGAYLITPAMGSHFVMYLAKMQENSESGLPPRDAERFIFVVNDTAVLADEFDFTHLNVDSYAYLPPKSTYHLKCKASATLVVFERRYAHLENHRTKLIVSSTDKQPLLETPGEVFELGKLLPTSLAYDFNIHIMDFQPGEFLNVKEVHYNQHGLLLLEGQGIYRLGDSWYPVQAGDAIWMAPFVPQWYAALGKSRSLYLLYKDVNRNPM